MRIRELTDDISNPVDIRRTINGVDALLATVSVGCESSESRRTEDVITPQFRVRQARGEVIMNPFESLNSKIDAVSPNLDYTLNKVYVGTGTGDPDLIQHVYATGSWSARQRAPRTPIPLLNPGAYAAEMAAFSLPGANEEQLVLARALEKASHADTLALVTMAELDKTVNLIGDCAYLAGRAAGLLESIGPTGVRRLKAFLRRYGRLSTKAGRRQALQVLGKDFSNIAGVWLGYRYGIMATYYDIVSWTEAAGPGDKRVRLTSTLSTEYENISDWVETYSDNYVLYEERTVRRRKSTTTGGVLVAARALSNADRFGVNRLLSTGYEMVMLSFVLDWVLDVGTRLAAWEGGLSIQPLGTWVSHMHTLEFTHSYRSTWKNHIIGDYRYWASGNDIGTTSEVVIMRKRIANPELSPLPSVSVRMNWKRIIDSIALLGANSKRVKSLMAV